MNIICRVSGLLLTTLSTLSLPAQPTTVPVAGDSIRQRPASVPQKPNRFFATEYLGLAAPIGAATRYVAAGFRESTGVEFRVTSRFWLTASLNIDLYGYNRLDNGVTIKGQVSLIQPNVAATYVLLKKAKFQPYVTGGVGLAYLSIPVAEVNYNTRQILVTNQGDFFFACQAGLGVQRTLSSDLTIFAETSYQLVPTINYAGVPNLQHVSLQVGVKTPF